MTNVENGFQKDTKDLHSRRDEARADRVGGRKWEEKIDEEEESRDGAIEKRREAEGEQSAMLAALPPPPLGSRGHV